MHTTALKNLYPQIFFLTVIFSLFLSIGNIFFTRQNHVEKPGIPAHMARKENHLPLPGVSITAKKTEENTAIITGDCIRVLAPESS